MRRVDLSTGAAKYLVFNNVRSTRNGRQGMSIINACFGVFNGCEFSQTGKTGNYGFHVPAAGMDIEPHYGPLGDNQGNMTHVSDEWNGFFSSMLAASSITGAARRS